MDTRTGQIYPSYHAVSAEDREFIKPINRPLLQKEVRKMVIDPYSPCGCGSGKKFKFCCKAKP